ncbi:nuclear pore complex subunit [Umbelopsis nana]
MSASLSLKQIFEKSQLLTTHISNPELPPLDRGIDQIEHLSQNLVQKENADASQSDIRAHYFLAKGGVNAQAMARHLDTVKLTSTFDLRRPVHDTDIEGYLRQEHQRVIAHKIEAGRCETSSALEKAYDKDLDTAWQIATKDSAKQSSDSTSLFKSSTENLLGLDEISGIAAKFGSNTLQQLLAPINVEQPISFDTSSHPHLLTYANLIYEFNLARLQKSSFDIISKVVKVTTGQAFSQHPVLKFMPLVIKFTEEAEKYGIVPHLILEEGEAGRVTRTKMIELAKSWLEEQYFKYLTATIQRQTTIFPGTSSASKIKSYVSTLHSAKSIPNLEVVNGEHPWANIFYHMRAGLNKEALEYIKNNQSVFKSAPSIAEYFEAYLADLTDRSMTDLTRSRIQLEYDQMSRNTAEPIDPYKFAVYKIMGRCELNKRTLPHITNSTEDWLWLQLCLIREPVPGFTNSGDYTLADLQKILQRYGPDHFDPHRSNPWNYITLLLLTLQFEQVVNQLYAIKWQIEAVHFAIGFAAHGVIRTTTDTQRQKEGLLIIDDIGVPTLNFVHLIHQYSLLFTISNPEIAFQYLLTISVLDDGNSNNKRATELCRSYIEELVTNTRAYSVLLGCRTVDDKVERGCIDEFKDLIQVDDAFIRSLTVAAADKCRHEERHADAVALYYLVGDHVAVVDILIRELGKEMMQPAMRQAVKSSDGWSLNIIPSNGEELVKYARDVSSRYGVKKPGDHISEQRRNTLQCLAKLHEFRYLYINGVAEQALEALNEIGIIPMEGDMSVIARKAEQLEDWEDAIVRCIPNVLLMTLTLLHELFNISKRQSDTNKMVLIKEKSRSILNFSGLIENILPADVCVRLNRLDIEMI